MDASIDRWGARLLAAGLVSAAVLAASFPGPGSGPDATGIRALAMQASGQCEDPALHEFDFWIGTWTVTNPDGDTVGVNRISATAGGCGLLEEWEGSSGSVGTSLTAYDPGRDEWFHHWVGSGDGSRAVRRGHRANVASVAPAAVQPISRSSSVSTRSAFGTSGPVSATP